MGIGTEETGYTLSDHMSLIQIVQNHIQLNIKHVIQRQSAKDSVS